MTVFFEAGVNVQDAFVASAWSGRDDAAEFLGAVDEEQRRHCALGEPSVAV